MKIVLPFPASILAGHATKASWAKIAATKAHRARAKEETLAVMDRTLPAEGDIALTIRFVPPNNLSDRINFPNRMKPYFDGIADALGVNDKRFLPLFIFCEPEKPGCVEVFVQ